MYLNNKKNPPDTDIVSGIVVGGNNFHKIKLSGIVGYCHSNLHKGYITKTTLKSHECLSKDCSSCEIYEKYPYWKERQKRVNAKKQRKLEEKNKKKESRKRERRAEFIKQVLNNTCSDIIVTGITEDKRNHYIINYVSYNKRNDEYEMKELLKEANNYYRNFCIRHIKGFNGTYMTIDEYKKIKQI